MELMELSSFWPWPGTTKLPAGPTFWPWAALLATLQADLSVQDDFLATLLADLSVQDDFLETLQAEPSDLART